MERASTAYCALIRTFNSERTVSATLASLAAQTCPPAHHIFVDSGSTDSTLRLLPPGSILHRYQGPTFNYAEAINQGLQYVDTDYVLIISSHTMLSDKHAVSFAMRLLADDQSIGAAYFSNEPSQTTKYTLIDSRNFNGFNGMWNTCALIRTSLLRKRSFRPEVFSAEDQEWASWLFEKERKCVARISGAGMEYNNPIPYSLRKRLNEHIAVAMFVRPEMLRWRYIARVAYRAIRPVSTFRERRFNAHLAAALIGCRLPALRPRAQHSQSARRF